MIATSPSLNPPDDKIVFHLCQWAAWEEGLEKGVYIGAPQARQDGFLHLSTLSTLAESANLHMSGLPDLYVLVVNAEEITKLLKWEYAETRQAYFPHVYGDLPLKAVLAALPVPLGAEDGYIFPDLSIF